MKNPHSKVKKMSFSRGIFQTCKFNFEFKFETENIILGAVYI